MMKMYGFLVDQRPFAELGLPRKMKSVNLEKQIIGRFKLKFLVWIQTRTEK